MRSLLRLAFSTLHKREKETEDLEGGPWRKRLVGNEISEGGRNA